MTTTTDTTVRPAIFQTFADIDTLDTPPTVEIKASALREGMVLVDLELGCPEVGIDHRVRATRGSGAVAFLVANLDRGGWDTVSIHANATVRVVAR